MNYIVIQMKKKKVLRETQTLRAGCSKAELKNFAPPQTPFPGVRYGQTFNQLEIQTQFSEDRCMQFRRIVVTVPHRPSASSKHTDRTDYNTLRR